MATVRDDPSNPDEGFAQLYAQLPDATDLWPWLELAQAAAPPVLYLGIGPGPARGGGSSRWPVMARASRSTTGFPMGARSSSRPRFHSAGRRRSKTGSQPGPA